MTRDLFQEAREHGQSEGELEAWLLTLSDDEREQLWKTIRDLLVRISEKLNELTTAAAQSLPVLEKWMDENPEFVEEMRVRAGRDTAKAAPGPSPTLWMDD